jgi:hypothetical protein
MTSATGLGSQLLDAIRSGSAPRPARLAAARGALPLSREELVLLEVELLQDADDEIAAAARATLDELSGADAAALAAERETPSVVLAWLAENLGRWPDVGPALAAHRRTDGATLRTIAGSSHGEALAALAVNERALTGDAALRQQLLDNPALPEAARARLLDVLDELAKLQAVDLPLEVDGLAADEPDETADEAQPARDPFLASLGVDAELEAMLPELDIDIGELAERSELLGDAETEEEGSLIARLSQMKVGQKLKLALLGSREERTVLIRDSNRQVATAVVKNPKFTEPEAEAAANSRNVNEEVLRLVATHRDFGGVYKIRHSLVKNPRCPAQLAVRFVPELREQDLKLLLKNRNVADSVRRQAKRQLEIIASRRRVRLRPGKH